MSDEDKVFVYYTRHIPCGKKIGIELPYRKIMDAHPDSVITVEGTCPICKEIYKLVISRKELLDLTFK